MAVTDFTNVNPDGASGAAMALVTKAIAEEGIDPTGWDECCGDADPKAVALDLANLISGLFAALPQFAGNPQASWANYCTFAAGRRTL